MCEWGRHGESCASVELEDSIEDIQGMSIPVFVKTLSKQTMEELGWMRRLLVSRRDRSLAVSGLLYLTNSFLAVLEPFRHVGLLSQNSL